MDEKFNIFNGYIGEMMNSFFVLYSMWIWCRFWLEFFMIGIDVCYGKRFFSVFVMDISMMIVFEDGIFEIGILFIGVEGVYSFI